jgi:hypothetical protein
MPLDTAVAGLLGAAIGGGVAILKSFIDGRSQRNLEQAKAKWSREGTVATELRTHVATVARELLSAQHSMEWLCWQTQQGSKQLDEKAVTDYHGEIHATFPKLLGALAAVSSLNARAYNDVQGAKVLARALKWAGRFRGSGSKPPSVLRLGGRLPGFCRSTLRQQFA